MLRKLRLTLILALVVTMGITGAYANTNSEVTSLVDSELTDDLEVDTQIMKGLWVASVYGIDYPSKATNDPDLLKKDADQIINTALEAGMNAIILQVRPTSDALYDSDIFPWSKFLTGQEDLAPAMDFDPLTYWIEQAHLKGIEIHAWINPYRVTRDMSKTVEDPVSLLSAENPARLHQDWVVRYTDGNLYYDPGLPEVRQLILDGVEELILNYDIDGIHFDDYFYPGSDFLDDETYEAYKLINETKGNFRRRVVTQMISDVDTLVKSLDETCAFGVSPFGIWANDTSLAGGSATRGNESYFAHYADTLDWVKNGYVDYIAPQIYWHMGFEIADYEILAEWWSDVVEGTDVQLVIGQAAYRTQETDDTKAWYGTAEIKNQLIFNQGLKNYGGSIFYNYSAFKNHPDLKEVVADGLPLTIAERLFPSQRLEVTSTNVTLSLYAPVTAIVNTNINGRYFFLKRNEADRINGLVKYELDVPLSAFKGQRTYRLIYRVRLNGINHDLPAPELLYLP